MSERSFVLAIDQSTQGTKAVLFDDDGACVAKVARPHRQLVNAKGWVSHDPEEIVTNVLAVARDVCSSVSVRQGEVKAVGLSNQRETCVAWDRESRLPLANAIVWQCGRAADLVQELTAADPTGAAAVPQLSGLTLSPYFSAAKMAWLLRNVPPVQDAADNGTLCLGTIDSWLLFKLTKGQVFATEPSNACRTQLLDLATGTWSPELCAFFGVPIDALPPVLASNAPFGVTTMGGLFDDPVPICGVLGDSQAALFAQGCTNPGDVKVTYGTGSSVMMQTGPDLVRSDHGLVTSMAWRLGEECDYVLEGNVNYSGAVITWLQDQMGLIASPAEVAELAEQSNPQDRSFFVPAFTGLGAPWWDSDATGLLTGVTRTTGRNEMVRACTESIPLQVTDIVDAMRADTGFSVPLLAADGGASQNPWIMQRQADLAGCEVGVSSLGELSAGGVASLAGQSCGLYADNAVARHRELQSVACATDEAWRQGRLGLWHEAVQRACFKPKTVDA